MDRGLVPHRSGRPRESWAETLAAGEADAFIIDATKPEGMVLVRSTGDATDDLRNVPLNGFTFDDVTLAAVTGSNLTNGTTTPKLVHFDTAPFVRSVPNNIQTQSQTFGTGWTLTRATISADSVAAPDGTTTADSLIEDGTVTNTHLITSAVSTVVGITYNFSVYAKRLAAGSTRYLQFSGNGMSAASECPTFDLTGAGAVDVGATSAICRSATITSVGNGWYRCSAVISPGSAGALILELADDASTNTADTYSGDSTSGLYLWGAQLSTGAYLHPYRATVAAAWFGVPVGYDIVNSRYGMQVDWATTNFLLQSENLATTWTNTNSSETVNTTATLAPDGTNNADKIVEASDVGQVHQMNQTSASLTSGTTYIFSCYLKAAERTWARLNGATTRFADNFFCDFDLGNGIKGTPGAGTTLSGIQSIGNGWYRCWIGAACDSSGTNAFNIIIGEADADITYNGDGASGIYAWGAQIENTVAVATGVGVPSAYVNTGTATVARVADSIGCATSTYPHSDTNGTWITWLTPRWINSTSADRYWELSDGTANEFHLLQLVTADAPDSIGIATTDGGAAQVASGTTKTGSASLSGNKVACFYKLNDTGVLADGGSEVVDVACTMPTCTQLNIAYSAVTGVRILSSFIRMMTYVPRRMTTAEMQARTT